MNPVAQANSIRSLANKKEQACLLAGSKNTSNWTLEKNNSKIHQFNHRGNITELCRHVLVEAHMIEVQISSIDIHELVWHCVCVCL